MLLCFDSGVSPVRLIAVLLLLDLCGVCRIPAVSILVAFKVAAVVVDKPAATQFGLVGSIAL